LPGWFLEVLEVSISALRAEEQLSAALAGRIAGATSESWESATRWLRRMAQPFEPVPPTIINPKFAEWFEREGIPYQVIERTD
jgi:hypothetical protein